MASWFKQAVTQADNKTYEGAYLALAYIMGLAGVAILCMLGLSFVDVLKNKKEFNPAGLGGGISAVLGGLAAFLAGVGAYILMDRKQQFPPVSTTTTTDTTTTKTVAAAPEAGLVIEPLSSPKIGPEDAGARVALLKKTQNGKKGK